MILKIVHGLKRLRNAEKAENHCGNATKIVMSVNVEGFRRFSRDR